MRIELTGSVRSVSPDEGGTGSVVVVRGYPSRYPNAVQVELTLEDEQARAFAARYRQDSAVRISIEVDDPQAAQAVGVGGAA